MKKRIALILALACFIGVMGCAAEKAASHFDRLAPHG